MVVGGVVLAVVLLVGGPFVYFRVIEGDAPAPLALGSPSATAPAESASSGTETPVSNGTWDVASGSVVGYRGEGGPVRSEPRGRRAHDQVTGSITVDGTSVTDGSFTADMTSVTSDETRRDDQFTGRIIETATYPEAMFTLSSPVDLGSVPAVGKLWTARVTGDLTLHGVTNEVSFDLQGVLDGATAQVAGSIPITFADWNIANPSYAPVATTEDNGILEFSLNLSHA